MSVSLYNVMNLLKSLWLKSVTIYFGSHGGLKFAKMAGTQATMYKHFSNLCCVTSANMILGKASHVVKPRFKGWSNSPSS